MLELTITVKRNNQEIMLTAEQLKALLYLLDDLLEEDRINKNKRSNVDLSGEMK